MTDIQEFLDEAEKQPGEVVLGVIPYGASATLIVTNHRIFGKTQAGRNPHLFHGAIDYADMIGARYSAGMPIFGAPGISIEYRLADGNIAIAWFRFPGKLSGFLFYRLSGFDPQAIYELIMDQLNDKGDPHENSP